MIRSRGFVFMTSADFIVRSAYQMGKTPLLPLFAATLGAGDILLGFIVSVSTLTGMVLKPFFGILSDRWGRRMWLILGTILFAGMPFLYRFVGTPEQLVALRVAHGLATAIYGPVTLAYIASLSGSGRAERFAWFSMARNGGYVVGPAVAGWMLMTLDPVTVFTLIGVLSSAAFVPVVLLPEPPRGPATRRPPLREQVVAAFRDAGRTPAVWLAGGLDAGINVALYAVKAFLPLYALSMGANIAVAGAFFSAQEGAHMLLNPLGGRLGDRVGHMRSVAAGVSTIGVAIALLTISGSGAALLGPALLIGAGQAMVSPSTLALVSAGISEQRLGAGMGLVGAMRNAGKVAGPILAGMLIAWLDFGYTFRIIAAVLIATAFGIWARSYLPKEEYPKIAGGSPAG